MIRRWGVRVRSVALEPGIPRRETAWRLVRQMLPPSAALSTRCPACGADDHGPVRVSGVAARASVAYAGDRAFVAVSTDPRVRALGIDAERRRAPVRDAAGYDGLFAPEVPPSVRSWTRVEAVLKALGTGIRRDPRTVRPSGTRRRWRVSLEDADIIGWDPHVARGFRVSVAARVGDPGVPSGRSRR
ncbi:hypothetical protein GCM10010461_23720 [Microbacterium aurantiacum]